jgi:hypothetical protein
MDDIIAEGAREGISLKIESAAVRTARARAAREVTVGYSDVNAIFEEPCRGASSDKIGSARVSFNSFYAST